MNDSQPAGDAPGAPAAPPASGTSTTDTGPAHAAAPVIHVSAAVVTDEDGLALVVRKRGAKVFQQPGGKPELGETAIDAVVRELAEEIGVAVDPDRLEPLGFFEDVAANEPGHRVTADAFALRIAHAEVAHAAEIEEIRWLRESDVATTPLANLSRNHLIRFAWR